MLVGFGQVICKPITPQCERCSACKVCPTGIKKLKIKEDE